MPRDLNRASRTRGCLLGGAAGDALGAPVEFSSMQGIVTAFGPAGIQDFAPAYGRLGAITDDTQMTLFTAEGLIRAQVRYEGRGICHPPSIIHHALIRWLYTQGERSPALRDPPDGWLVGRRELFSQRAPGLTCLSSLRGAKHFGENAENDSKGCGAIMRIAPIGLFVLAEEHHEGGPSRPPRAYEIACESAKSTHGHPSSTSSSGFFALAIAKLLKGASLLDAINSARRPLEADEDAGEVRAAIAQALDLADSDAPSSPETVERLGQGWVAEEALAISLFCGLRAENFEHGVRLAVNHGGDSDSTGSLTGQLLGTLWGDESIPKRWLDELELRDVIEAIAADMVAVLEGGELSGQREYPGW